MNNNFSIIYQSSITNDTDNNITIVVTATLSETSPAAASDDSVVDARLFSSSSTLTGCLVGLGVTGIGVGLGVTGTAVGLTVGGATSASNNVHSLTPLNEHQISSVYPSAMAACFTSSGNSHQSYYSQERYEKAI